jgi:hypothetical protein
MSIRRTYANLNPRALSISGDAVARFGYAAPISSARRKRLVNAACVYLLSKITAFSFMYLFVFTH